MSRVERTESPEGKGAQQLRQARRGRHALTDQRQSNPGRTRSKAEGEERDVEEALQRQSE